MPERIAALPQDDAGRPVPFFVSWIDGVPDFRVVDPYKLQLCFEKKLCWVCGQKLGTYMAFVIGPMCAINRVNSEPPSHLGCARFSAQACPFLSTPRMHRRERGLPEGYVEPAGVAILRNPGATCLWITKSYKPFDAGNGVLFSLGPPTAIEWYAQGREATRAEVMESVQTGFPTLEKLALQDGPRAIKQLDRQYKEFLTLVPA